MAGSLGDALEAFRSLPNREELLVKVIEFFPYPIQVYAPDGTSVLVNRALLAEYRVSDAHLIIGQYNLFEDPSIIATGRMNEVTRAFRGEIVSFSDIRVPLEQIIEKYGLPDLDMEAAYQDITLFPIFDDQQEVAYVVALLVNRRVYRGKEEIERAKEFLENHWLEKFDAAKTAKCANLSKGHFTRLFRKHTGITPHQYYINCKVAKLKEKLLDPNLSVAQAFAACNMTYTGYAAKLFKERVGVSPSAYRKRTTEG